jgi:hypothetical protein
MQILKSFDTAVFIVFLFLKIHYLDCLHSNQSFKPSSLAIAIEFVHGATMPAKTFIKNSPPKIRQW